MTQIPAGWYPDPAAAQPGQPPQLRYWDGRVWTTDLSPAYTVPVAPQQPMYAGPLAPPAHDGPTTPDGVPLAGWGQRVAASVIDGVIYGAVGQVLLLPFGLAFGRELSRLTDSWDAEIQRTDTVDLERAVSDVLDVMRENMLWLLAPTVLGAFLYYGLFWRLKGATPGKLVLGLQIRLRDRPGQLPWSTVLLRWLAMAGVGSLLYLAIVFPLWAIVAAWSALLVYQLADSLWPLWDDRRQAIHDKVARTNVVKVR